MTIMVGYFDVAPDHNKDTLGYLHVNNPNTRLFIERMKSLNMLTDVFRHKHPDLRRFSSENSDIYRDMLMDPNIEHFEPYRCIVVEYRREVWAI